MLKIHKIPFGSSIKSSTSITGWRTKGKFYTRLPSAKDEFWYYTDDNIKMISKADSAWDFDVIMNNHNGWNQLSAFYYQRILYGKVFEINYDSGKKTFGIYLDNVCIQENEEFADLIQAFELGKEIFK